MNIYSYLYRYSLQRIYIISQEKEKTDSSLNDICLLNYL